MMMKAILADLFRRYTSRKFIAFLAGYSIIILAGFGYAEFSAEVKTIAASTVVAYIGMEGGGDVITRWRNGNGTPK